MISIDINSITILNIDGVDYYCIIVGITNREGEDILMMTLKFLLMILSKNRLKINIIIFLRLNLYPYFFELAHKKFFESRKFRL